MDNSNHIEVGFINVVYFPCKIYNDRKSDDKGRVA